MNLHRLIIILSVFAILPTEIWASTNECKPNILLIVTDDQGWWDVGVNGNKIIRTPYLDKLAQSGVNLTRFYAQPVCAPTRAGLLTGRYYLRTGVYNTRFGGDTMRNEEITLSEILRGLGYRTGLFGKWHLGRYVGHRPNDQGFDEFFGFTHGHIEQYDYSDQLQYNGKPVKTRGYVTDLFTDAAISFMKQNAKRPFFCFLSYNAPHSPFIVGDAHAQQEKGDALINYYLKKRVPIRDARIYAMIERIDSNIGRLLRALEELRLSENTLVIFMSDNGGVSRFFRAGLRGGKGSVYEGGVRVPCFVRWLGHFPTNTKINAMTSHLDILPTVCDLLKAPLPKNHKIDGRSLFTLLKTGKGTSPHEYLFHTWNRYFPDKNKRTAVQSSRWKLVGKQLFDLRNDPGEKRNVAKQNPVIVRKLRAKLNAWFTDVTAGHKYQPLPIPVGHPSDNPVELQASWAILTGKTIRYTFRAYDWDTIDSWRTAKDSALWNLRVLHAGKYEVTVSYSADHSSAGSVFRLSAGNRKMKGVVQPTITPDVFRKVRLGVMYLQKGRMQLRAEVVSARGKELMRLNRIWLRRLDK